MNNKQYWDNIKSIYQKSWYNSVEKRYKEVYGKRNKKISKLTKDR